MKKILALSVLLLAYAMPVYAYKEVPFPSSSKLQPIPISVKPELSKNVNGTSGFAAEENVDINYDLPNTDETTAGDTEEASATTTEPVRSSHLMAQAFIASSFVILALVGIYAIKKKFGDTRAS